MPVDHADTNDILKRLWDEIAGWPKIELPSAVVQVRADLVTQAYSEIDELRSMLERGLAATRSSAGSYEKMNFQRDATIAISSWSKGRG